MNDNTGDVTNKQILRVLSKPMKIALGVLTGLTGASAVTVFFLLSRWADYLKDNPSFVIPSWQVVLLVLSFVIAFLGVFAVAFLSVFSLLRLKINTSKETDSLSRSVKKIEEATNRLSHENQKSIMSNFILNGEQISNMESKVVGGARIVVMTSRFHLDKGKLLEIIINNICKGVVYEYLIPATGTYHRDFQLVYSNWWKQFYTSISSLSDDGDACFSEDYRKLKRITNKTTLKKQAKVYFTNHVKELQINQEHELVTIIMYQKAAQPCDEWDIIMKLPTVTDDDEYYAFYIGEEEQREKINLIRGIERLCTGATHLPLELDKWETGAQMK